MLYTWPAVYIVSLVIIAQPGMHTGTWRLIKDTFNSPLLSVTNPNTNPYPNPAHTARHVHMAGHVHSHTQTYRPMHLLYRTHEQFP